MTLAEFEMLERVVRHVAAGRGEYIADKIVAAMYDPNYSFGFSRNENSVVPTEVIEQIK